METKEKMAIVGPDLNHCGHSIDDGAVLLTWEEPVAAEASDGSAAAKSGTPPTLCPERELSAVEFQRILRQTYVKQAHQDLAGILKNADKHQPLPDDISATERATRLHHEQFMEDVRSMVERAVRDPGCKFGRIVRGDVEAKANFLSRWTQAQLDIFLRCYDRRCKKEVVGNAGSARE